jgi:DNA mismatch repair protein MLH3
MECLHSCRLDNEVFLHKLLIGDELRDLVKGFLGQLETDHPWRIYPHANEVDEDEFFWLKALRWCPRELIDLINSKACRGVFFVFAG